MNQTPSPSIPAVPDRAAAGMSGRGGQGHVVLIRPLPGHIVDLLVAPRPRPGRFRMQALPDSPATAGRSPTLPMEVSMFEEQPQPKIEALMKANPEFKQLYQRHKLLDKKVTDAELGVLPIDDVTLNQMKREKLAAKDRLLRMYDAQHH